MIYTSYFAKLKQLPEDVLPISICGKAPQWYTGLQYKKLAPKYDFFMKWKEDHDNNYYIKCFNEQVLGDIELLTFLRVILDMQNEASKRDGIFYNHVCLICYEKPTDFCHRHLVAEWLKNNEMKCEEYDFGKK